jgi:hypothetical protein
MKRSVVALTILGLSASPALAAPGDPRVVQGLLEWPATVTSEPFVVVRGEDGRLYYADISSAAQRRSAEALRAGSRVAVLGVEGARPHEVAALVIGAGDAASLGLAPPPPPGAPTAAAPASTSEGLWRVDGTVKSVAGTTVALHTEDSRSVSVDVSQLSEQTLNALRPGDRVSLFGVPRQDQRLVANGYIQSESAPPAASPPSR